MKTKVQHRRPFKAWLATLPLALGIPAIAWTIIEWKQLHSTGMWALVIFGIMMLVHLSAYLLTGLPIFLSLYRNANSPIWTPVIGIPLGAVLGLTAYFLTFAALGSLRQSVLLEPYFYLVGAGYGMATAIAALRERPQSE